VTRPQSPVQITALGIIALLHSKECHARQHHEPARAPEKSIEPGHALHSARVQSNRVSASAALRRNSYFVRLRSPLSITPDGIMSRLFRNVHHHGFWPQQLAVAWDRLLIAEPAE
jgi:hypothetical protein